MTLMCEYSRPMPMRPLSSTHRGPLSRGPHTSASCVSTGIGNSCSALDFVSLGGSQAVVLVLSRLPLATPPLPPTAPPCESSAAARRMSSSTSVGFCLSSAAPSRVVVVLPGTWRIWTSRLSPSGCGPGDIVTDRESPLVAVSGRGSWSVVYAEGERGRQLDGDSGSGEVGLLSAVGCEGCSSSGSGHDESG